MDTDQFLREFCESPLGQAYRFYGSRWYCFDDGYWSREQAKQLVTRAVRAMLLDLPDTPRYQEMRARARKEYLVTRLVTDLAAMMTVHRLPARLEKIFPESEGT
jgi:hypothetical protein